MTVKGQNIRFGVTINGTKVYFAASTSCQLHVAAKLEESSTKDNTGGWQEQECTGLSWDGSVDVNVIEDALDNALKALDVPTLVGQTVDVEVDLTNGIQNRVLVRGLYGGKAIISDFQMTAGNRANSTATIQFAGQGELSRIVPGGGSSDGDADAQS